MPTELTHSRANLDGHVTERCACAPLVQRLMRSVNNLYKGQTVFGRVTVFESVQVETTKERAQKMYTSTQWRGTARRECDPALSGIAVDTGQVAPSSRKHAEVCASVRPVLEQSFIVRGLCRDLALGEQEDREIARERSIGGQRYSNVVPECTTHELSLIHI